MVRSIRVLLLVAVCSCAHERGPVPQPVAGKLLLRGVTVVDTRDGALTSDVEVFMDAGRIVSVGPDSGIAPDASVQVVDGHGRFVVPGYLDMHAHALGPEDPSGSLTLMLANGITGFRQMNGSPALLAQRRAGTLPIGRLAPQLLAMPGSVLTPLNAGSPEEALATIREQKADGADFIKVAITSGPVFIAALGEARRQGIPILGHVPRDISVTAASEGGMRSIEHLGPDEGLLVACSSDEAGLRDEIAKLPVIRGPPVKVPFLDKLMASHFNPRVINPIAEVDAAEVARMQHALDTYSEEKCRQVAAGFVAHETWQVPTLIRLRTTEMCDAPEYRSDPNLRFVSPGTVHSWTEVTETFAKHHSPGAKQTLRDLYPRQLALVKLLDQAGVKMMTGTDLGGGWVIPGFSLHQEFDELEKAGLAPLEVLQMTTLNGAEFLGRTSTMGRVAPGVNADLVLLDADPIQSVQNLHRIGGVVRAGFYYSNADLEALKNRLRAEDGGLP